MSNLGRSVRLFLVDGKSTGLITAEIMNWISHVLTGRRAELPKFLTRDEISRTKSHLLFGRDTESTDNRNMRGMISGESHPRVAQQTGEVSLSWI
ncbi:MAG: hypothetical protein EOM91_17795 [Sphingobacteriia bacterium]|nr:hypothetical protein [Sphingobacteriia bacterium]NCC41329.1 hypothetical protein [Gammaproteobacteria bacterium]